MTLSSLYVLLYVLLLLFMLTYKEMGFTGTFLFVFIVMVYSLADPEPGVGKEEVQRLC